MDENNDKRLTPTTRTTFDGESTNKLLAVVYFFCPGLIAQLLISLSNKTSRTMTLNMIIKVGLGRDPAKNDCKATLSVILSENQRLPS